MDIHDHYLLRITVMSLGPMLTYKFVEALYQPMANTKKSNNLNMEEGFTEGNEEENNPCFEDDESVFFEFESENSQPTYKIHTRV